MFTKRFTFLILLVCLGTQVTYSQIYSKKLVRLAKSRFANAQTLLSVCYDNVSKIYDEAVKWYKKTAEGDKPSENAMHNIAKGYGNGRNVQKDMGKANYWMNKDTEYSGDYALDGVKIQIELKLK